MHQYPELTVQTRQNLIDAFWSLYSHKSIEKITVREICDKAGYSRSTFYEYFKDVYDVLEQIEKSLIPRMDDLPPISLGEKNVGAPLELLIAMYEQNSKYYAVLLGEKGDPSFVDKIKSTVKPVIKQALCSDVTTDNVQLDIVLEYTLSSMIGVLSFWFRAGKPLPADALIKLMQQITSYGIARVLSGLS